MGESQDSFLTQETMTDKDAQKRCCQWSRKSMTITITVCIASVLILVAVIIRFHANVRPDEKYASIGTIPFPAITICPGIRSGYPNKNNFNRTLFLMQTEAAPKLRPRKYEGHSCVVLLSMIETGKFFTTTTTTSAAVAVYTRLHTCRQAGRQRCTHTSMHCMHASIHSHSHNVYNIVTWIFYVLFFLFLFFLLFDSSIS